MQYNLSKISYFGNIQVGDSIILDYDDNITTWDNIYFHLNQRAVEIDCELVRIQHKDNFQPPFFDRKYYDTVVFNLLQ